MIFFDQCMYYVIFVQQESPADGWPESLFFLSSLNVFIPPHNGPVQRGAGTRSCCHLGQTARKMLPAQKISFPGEQTLIESKICLQPGHLLSHKTFQMKIFMNLIVLSLSLTYDQNSISEPHWTDTQTLDTVVQLSIQIQTKQVAYLSRPIPHL